MSLKHPVGVVLLLVLTACSTPRVSGPATAGQIPPPDRVPRATYRVPPALPAALRTPGSRGHALISFVIDRDGRVIEATVVQATNPLFGEAARQAVLTWRFEPGIRNGHPVKTRMQVPLDYVWK